MIDLLTDLWETEGDFSSLHLHLLTIVRYMFAAVQQPLQALSGLAKLFVFAALVLLYCIQQGCMTEAAVERWQLLLRVCRPTQTCR
jgi:hypothetical protein